MGAGHARTKGAQTRWDNNIKSELIFILVVAPNHDNGLDYCVSAIITDLNCSVTVSLKVKLITDTQPVTLNVLMDVNSNGNPDKFQATLQKIYFSKRKNTTHLIPKCNPSSILCNLIYDLQELLF